MMYLFDLAGCPDLNHATAALPLFVIPAHEGDAEVKSGRHVDRIGPSKGEIRR
jgi:hypothetical protein